MSIVGRKNLKYKYVPPKKFFPKGKAYCSICKKKYDIKDCTPDMIEECLVFRCPEHQGNIIYFSRGSR